MYVGDYSPNVRPVPAPRGPGAGGARATSAGRGLGAHARACRADDELTYLHEYEHVTLARILLAQQTPEAPSSDALRLLDRLLAAAEAGGRVGTVIEILALQALRAAGGDRSALER